MRVKAAGKQFLEKDRAVELAASIVTAQEQKLQQKLEKGYAQKKQAGQDRSTRRQSSRAKLKETMAKLAAQKVKKTEKRRQETKAGEGSEGGHKPTGKRVAFMI
ncbi:hypothetical protein APHAL10511_007191 [Amanita phalloides]|nr:hypothetical protein APHAL10511_007191 [Amanita phalloides]